MHDSPGFTKRKEPETEVALIARVLADTVPGDSRPQGEREVHKSIVAEFDAELEKRKDLLPILLKRMYVEELIKDLEEFEDFFQNLSGVEESYGNVDEAKEADDFFTKANYWRNVIEGNIKRPEETRQ